MSDCLHCEIHDLLEPRLHEDNEALSDIAAKVTEVLADLILTAPSEEQTKLMADIVANLGHFVLEKSAETPAAEFNPRRH
jgi:hypothetical protein